MRKHILCVLAYLIPVSAWADTYTIDTRKYVDFDANNPVVKIENAKGKCTGTLVRSNIPTDTNVYVLTAAHCYYGPTISVEREHGGAYTAKLVAAGDIDSHASDQDWALYRLTDVDVTNVPGIADVNFTTVPDTAYIYGYGALRILSDEEIKKIREYVVDYQKNNPDGYTDIDVLLDRLSEYDVFDDDRLKEIKCNIDRVGDNTFYSTMCFTSDGDSGGGVFAQSLNGETGTVTGIVSASEHNINDIFPGHSAIFNRGVGVNDAFAGGQNSPMPNVDGLSMLGDDVPEIVQKFKNDPRVINITYDATENVAKITAELNRGIIGQLVTRAMFSFSDDMAMMSILEKNLVYVLPRYYLTYVDVESKKIMGYSFDNGATWTHTDGGRAYRPLVRNDLNRETDDTLMQEFMKWLGY